MKTFEKTIDITAEMTIIDSVKSVSLKYQSNKNKGDLTMKRFIKEYANYIREDRMNTLSFRKSCGEKIDFKEELEFDQRIDKLLKLRERDLISTGEVMVELTKMAYPAMMTR